ncbi:MAG: sensor histidine kinase [Lachnospiraceae bacterium]
MSTCIESFIIFILCMLLLPTDKLDALHITCILVLFSVYCFELVVRDKKTRQWLGIISLLLCFFVSDLSVFLPFCCYIFFYHKDFLLPYLYALPAIIYLFQSPDHACYAILPLTALSFYLAVQNRERDTLKNNLHILRDTNEEEEQKLKQTNQQLLESQNDQIYIATLKERNRIAREIHDNVGHMLSRSILQVGALLAVCKDDTLKPHLENLKETLDTAMNSIRSSVHDLHDESIDLQHALSSLTDNFTFCAINLDCDISKNVPKEIKYCFLAIVKEALNNTIKHSNATKVNVTVKEHPAFYQLLIEDNGMAKTISSDTAGIGLSNMKERVDSLHGILHIKTEQGFQIFVSVPK